MLALFTTAVFAFVTLQAATSPPAAAAQSGDARKMTLVLPHALRSGETAWLLVRVGAIDHKLIRLSTEDGRSLGTLSPFGARSGHGAGTYTVPVPTEAFHDERLALRISVVESGRAPRAPTSDEVRDVRLVIRRFKEQPSSGANP